ncbi:TPA: hypothetical protein HA251_02390 [Candidatus Woesearchaeota archaeon]|nr:hypothetical protein [Candidatus Woesearchaeota archaeon]
MHSTSERFKPAGHKAQELSEIVLPKETFKPIQRVIDTTLEQDDKTIGYLYHDVEYTPGVVGRVVLSKGFLRVTDKELRKNTGEWQTLCDTDKELRKNTGEWQKYEKNDIENPLGWFVPSAPVTLELCYRTQQGDTAISREAQRSWRETFNSHMLWSLTSTILEYEKERAIVYHNWTTNAGTTPTAENTILDHSGNNSPIVNTFLRATLGQRYSAAKKTFEKYGSPVALCTPKDNSTSKHALVLGVFIGRFDIGADGTLDYYRPARGVSLLKNFKSPQYEVHDV